MQIELVYSEKDDYVKEGTLVGISIENTTFYLEGYDSDTDFKTSEAVEKISEEIKPHLNFLKKMAKIPRPTLKEVKKALTPLVKDRKRLDP